MSTFSDTGSFRMTSGAIQATVPAKDILVLLSLSSFEVPKSEIFTRSSCVISMLQKKRLHVILIGNNKESIVKLQVMCWLNFSLRWLCCVRWLTWGTWGPDGWFCGGGGSSCHLRCPWTIQPGGRGWFYGPPSAPHTVGPGHSIPSRYSNKEPGCTRPWKEARQSDNKTQVNRKGKI